MGSTWTSFSSKLQKKAADSNASTINCEKQNAAVSSCDKDKRPKLDTQTKAIAIIRDVLKNKSVGYKLVTYKTFVAHHRLRSKAYEAYTFLVHDNTLASAGWILCSYALNDCCPFSKAVKVFDVTRGGTTTLVRHSESHHKLDSENRLTLFHTLSNGEREGIAKGAVYAVLKDMRPLGFAQKDSGLQMFTEAVFKVGQRTATGVTVRPEDLMPCRQTIRNHLSRMVSTARESFSADSLPRLLHAGGGVTCDGMKHSITGRKFYDLVAHWAEYTTENIFTNQCDIEVKSHVLLLIPVLGPETAENIRITLNEAFQSRYGVPLDRLFARHTLVTDCTSTLPVVVGASASSNKVPLSSVWMGCVCHQLNTCMKKVLDHDWSTEPFQTIRSNLNAAKTIVRIFKKSSVVLPSGLQLKQEVETRFSTTFLVVERFLECCSEMREAILSMPNPPPSLLQAYGDLEFEVLHDNFATLPALNAIYVVCKPIVDMQRIMERSNKPTLHRLIPMLEHCKNVLAKISSGNVMFADIPSCSEATRSVSCTGFYVRELAKKMLEHLSNIEVHPLWSAGCILHPRLKVMTCVTDPSRREQYMRAGKTEIRKMKALFSGTNTTSDTVGTGNQSFADHSQHGIGAEDREERRLHLTARDTLQFSLETALDCPVQNLNTGDELAKYIKSSIPTNVSDLMSRDDLGSLRWWVKMRGTYPILHKVALKVLSTPASSCASERDFSLVNNTVTASRSCLTTDAIEDLIVGKSFMNNNLAI